VIARSENPPGEEPGRGAPRILLAFGHAIHRTGVRELIGRRPDLEVVAEAATAEEALEAMARTRPDLAIVESELPGLAAAEPRHLVAAPGAHHRVLLLVPRLSEDQLRKALRSGVAGVLSRSSDSAELFDAIDALCAGRSFVSRSLTQALIHALAHAPDAPAQLTKREIEVLQLIAEGLSSREISERIGVARRTVESHRGSLMDKLGARNTAALVRVAIRAGLLEP